MIESVTQHLQSLAKNKVSTGAEEHKNLQSITGEINISLFSIFLFRKKNCFFFPYFSNH